MFFSKSLVLLLAPIAFAEALTTVTVTLVPSGYTAAPSSTATPSSSWVPMSSPCSSSSFAVVPSVTSTPLVSATVSSSATVSASASPSAVFTGAGASNQFPSALAAGAIAIAGFIMV